MTYLENPISEKVLAHRINRDNRNEDRRFLIQYLTQTIMFEFDYANDEIYIDPFYRDFLGFDVKEEKNDGFQSLLGAVYRPHKQSARDFLDLTNFEGAVSRRITLRMLASSGAYEWYRLTLICYAKEDKTKDFLIITATNVEHEMKAIKEIEFLAESDSLTRIPNKETFLRRTKRMLDKNADVKYVLIRMDVERFSTINQLYGASEGDKVIKYIAVKLQEYVEADPNGTYCRFESDVFGACLPFIPENVAELENYIQDALYIYPLKFEIRASFGYYVITDSDTAIETMFDRAYAAQKTIKGSVIQHAAYYDENMLKKERQEQRITLEMRSALDQGQFHVYLQPKCDMKTGAIIGSEELVRWIHPELGMISPGDFIPLFEKNGFISELDRYILRKCCEIVRGWLDNGVKVLPISVNISRTDLYNPKLFENILQTVDSFGVPHDAIEFELTESSFVTDSAPLTKLNNNLRGSGFKVLMDDFGSGYSSLNCLRELNVDVLKIDLKFLPASRDDKRAFAILSAVVDMAAKLDLTIIVEGVETQEQADFMLELGCRRAQGFFFHRPMPVSEYEKKI